MALLWNKTHGLQSIQGAREMKAHQSRRNGQTLLELAGGLIVLIPIVLLFIDIGALVLGATANDSICRDAARAAAAVQPGQSLTRATQVINLANNNPGLMQIAVVSVQVNANPAPPSQDGGIVQGNVTVTTQANVNPFTILRMMNPGQPIAFRSVQSFPYTFVWSRQGLPPL